MESEYNINHKFNETKLYHLGKNLYFTQKQLINFSMLATSQSTVKDFIIYIDNTNKIKVQ